MFKIAAIIFAAIFFIGCAMQKPPEEIIEPVAPSAGVSSLNWTNSEAEEFSAPQKFQQPVAPIVRTNLPAPKIVQPAPPVTTWQPLAQWTSAHHVDAPHRLSDMPVAAYAVGSKNGVMILTIGSREATWNGIQINLGFAPQFIDGEIFLHGLDLEKNLEPLLCEPPISFAKTNRVIVIDPGHGGSNVGTQSVLDGKFEKEFTLDTALRLKPLLETNGWTVFLTRTSDVYVTNESRVIFADEHRADLFISLHFNATGDRSQKTGGVETYCITPVGMPSTLTRNFGDPWNENLPNNSFDAQNLQLAVKLQNAIVHSTSLDDRGVCRARFMTVLQGQRRPAILIENGYLSNPHDAKLIESPEFRQKLAETIADALK